MDTRFGVMPGEYPPKSSDDPQWGELPKGKAEHGQQARARELNPEQMAVVKELVSQRKEEEALKTLGEYGFSPDDAADMYADLSVGLGIRSSDEEPEEDLGSGQPPQQMAA